MPDIRLQTIGAVLLAFVVAAVVVRVAHAVVHRVLNALDIVGAENRAAVHARARQLTRALTLLAYGVAALASISLALERFGVNEPRWNPRLLGHWALTHGVNLVIIAVGAFIVVRAANLAIEHLQFKLARRHAADRSRVAAARGDARRHPDEHGHRLGRLRRDPDAAARADDRRRADPDRRRHRRARDRLRRAEPGPRRHLGFFLILEDQVRIGDLARINGVAGTVEQINLRTIVLRDGEGAVQVFPNGTITALANLSKQFAYAVVDVRIAYSENIGSRDGHDARSRRVDGARPAWGAFVLAPLEIVGIESLADGAATVRVKFKTQPLNQGKVANELRRRLMGAFVGRGIKPLCGERTLCVLCNPQSAIRKPQC